MTQEQINTIVSLTDGACWATIPTSTKSGIVVYVYAEDAYIKYVVGSDGYVVYWTDLDTGVAHLCA